MAAGSGMPVPGAGRHTTKPHGASTHTQEEHDRHGEWPAGHALLATQVNNSIINILRAIRLLISFLGF